MILFISPSFRTVTKFRKDRMVSSLYGSYKIRIPLFDLVYTTSNDKSWCEVQNALKAV